MKENNFHVANYESREFLRITMIIILVGASSVANNFDRSRGSRGEQFSANEGTREQKGDVSRLAESGGGVGIHRLKAKEERRNGSRERR